MIPKKFSEILAGSWLTYYMYDVCRNIWEKSVKQGFLSEIMPRFVKGLKLSALYYERAVRPILESDFPELEYSAGLIGSGSEVLGYDTWQSSDHNWGPRLFIFLSENNFEESRDKVDLSLREKLPYTFLGYSTSFGKPDQIGDMASKSD